MKNKYMKEVYIEHWTSDENNGREDHYFIDPEKKVWLFGYNPTLITEDQLKKIFEILSINM